MPFAWLDDDEEDAGFVDAAPAAPAAAVPRGPVEAAPAPHLPVAVEKQRDPQAAIRHWVEDIDAERCSTESQVGFIIIIIKIKIK
mgnify:CR=1 FL=1